MSLIELNWIFDSVVCPLTSSFIRSETYEVQLCILNLNLCPKDTHIDRLCVNTELRAFISSRLI